MSPSNRVVLAVMLRRMITRRKFLRTSVAAGAAISLSPVARATQQRTIRPADAMVLIYLPGGIAHQDFWDVKEFTPFRAGMKASDLRSTCRSISTNVEGILLGEGLENLAQVMDKAAILRSIASNSLGNRIHLKAQHELITGQPFIEGRDAPSIGSTIASQLGARSSKTPPYIYIGREGGENDAECLFINKYISAGNLGDPHNPQMFFDRASNFSDNLTLARNLLEEGARFIQVEMQYAPFKGFDTHEYGAQRTIEMKQQVDRPLANFIRDLDQRGLLQSTIVAVMTEFGRTVPSGESAIIAEPSQYGFHAHYADANCALFFGGPFKRGFTYGKTADMHPMRVIENPVSIADVHATIRHAIGTSGQSAGKVIAPLLA